MDGTARAVFEFEPKIGDDGISSLYSSQSQGLLFRGVFLPLNRVEADETFLALSSGPLSDHPRRGTRSSNDVLSCPLLFPIVLSIGSVPFPEKHTLNRDSFEQGLRLTFLKTR